jgi:hypothetical protein
MILPARLSQALDALRVNEVEMKRFILVASLSMFTFSSLLAQNNSHVPVTWKKAEACGVSFYLPPDMTAPYQGQIGLDECAEIFQSATIHISLETDPFPFTASKPSFTRFNNLSRKVNFKRVETKIGSRRAVIVSYYESNAEGFNYHSALSIAVKGGFRMFVSMKYAEDQSIAEKIFHSVVFSGGNRASNNSFNRSANSAAFIAGLAFNCRFVAPG